MKRLFYLISLIFLGASCEQNIDVNIPDSGPEYVVEGHISNNTPPYIILTKTAPFFEGTNMEDIENSFVHDAKIIVSDGVKSVELKEYSSDSLPKSVIELLKQQGLDLPGGGSQREVSFSFYTDFSLLSPFLGEAGKSYYLDIDVEGTKLSSVTTIPQLLPLDTIFVSPHPEEGNRDSLVILNVTYSDPVASSNYIRYFTSINSEPFYTPFFNSVADDKSFLNLDGRTLTFALDRGVDPYDEDKFKNYSYYKKGDTVTVRWSSIDEAHYNFWLTLESDRSQSGSPFGRPTVINSNIEGGVGIWGGYGDSFYTIIIPKD